MCIRDRCKDSSYRFINTAGNKFCADCGLEVISDIALTHCRTYGHRCKCIVRMCFAKFIHGCVAARGIAAGRYKKCNADADQLRSSHIADIIDRKPGEKIGRSIISE